jgi:transcriptional regulator with XRE-family HTH domain
MTIIRNFGHVVFCLHFCDDLLLCRSMNPRQDAPEKITRSRGRPTLPPEEAERVRLILVGICAAVFENNEAALARALDMSQSAIWQIRAKRNRPSTQTARRLADLLGVSEQVVRSGKASVEALVRRCVPHVRASALTKPDPLPATGTDGA